MQLKLSYHHAVFWQASDNMQLTKVLQSDKVNVRVLMPQGCSSATPTPGKGKEKEPKRIGLSYLT